LLSLLLLPVLLGQTHGQWEASVRTEARARTANAQDAVLQPGPSGQPQGDTAGDLEVRPHLGGAIFNGPWSLSGGYTPTLWVREPYRRAHVDHSHVFQVDASWAREGSPRVFLDEYVNYGTLDVSTYGTAATMTGSAPVQPPGVVPNTLQLTSDGQLGVEWPLSRRVSMITSVGYTFGGGLTKEAQVGTEGPIQPLQSSPRAAVRVAWQASRKDTLTFNALGSYTSFQASDDCFVAGATDCKYKGARIGIAELSVRYVRLFAEHTSADATLGVTAAYGQLPGLEQPPGTEPMGELGLSHRIQLRAQRIELRAAAQAGPYVDRFRGTVYERVEGNGSVSWGNATGLFAYARGGVSQSLTGTSTSDLLTAYVEGGAGYQGAPWWRVDLSAREAAQRSGTAPGATMGPGFQSQWIVGLAVTFTAVSAPQTTATE
jgi:hypothetical protein